MWLDDLRRLDFLKPEICPLDRQLWRWRLGLVVGAFMLAVWLGVGAAVLSVRVDSSSHPPVDLGIRTLRLEQFEKNLSGRLENQLQAEVETKTAQRGEE